MGLNGGVGGGWGLTLGRGRNRNRGGERELASNGSLMRDGTAWIVSHYQST